MKGTRLSEDFILPEDWKAWAIEERPDLNISEIFEEFKDYWISKTGQGATKLNWLATWRNWIRRTRGAKPDSRPVPQQMRKEKLPGKEEWKRTREEGKKRMEEVRRALR